jgi:hypothetical protein
MVKRIQEDIGLVEMNVSEQSHGNAFVGRSMMMNPMIFNGPLGSNSSLNGPVGANHSYELSASSEIEGRLA